ncbi:hypothetical protein Tco_0475339 [Tanacetum coccineum]
MDENEVASRGWSFASAVPGQMTHLVASLTLDSANSCVMQGASCTQRKVSMVLFVLPSILLLVVIVVTVVIVVVIPVVVVVAIVGVVVVVVVPLVPVFLLGLLALDIDAACFSRTGLLPNGRLDLIGDEDSTNKDGDIGVLVSLGGEIFLEGKESHESNIGDSDNTRDGGKTTDSKDKRSLVESSEKLGEVFPGEARE